VRYLKLALDRKPDVIISAVPVEEYDGTIPVIVSHDLLSEKAISRIQEQIWQKICIEKELMRYFDPDCFGYISAENRFQAIKELGAMLERKKGIGSQMIKAIEKRERISSTEVGNLVAVPHVLMQGEFSSCIAIGILDNPVQWGSEMVQMVFLACFNQSGNQYARIFRTLYKVVHSEELVRRLIQADDFYTFQNIMCGREV
ncbi:MAG: PTS sugar transporter subunit IIA, partial [Lacrimispora sphenoides]